VLVNAPVAAAQIFLGRDTPIVGPEVEPLEEVVDEVVAHLHKVLNGRLDGGPPLLVHLQPKPKAHRDPVGRQLRFIRGRVVLVCRCSDARSRRTETGRTLTPRLAKAGLLPDDAAVIQRIVDVGARP
jgi:hypothetical protein